MIGLILAQLTLVLMNLALWYCFDSTFALFGAGITTGILVAILLEHFFR